MAKPSSNPSNRNTLTPVGLIALHSEYCPEYPEPAVQSYVWSGQRKTDRSQEQINEYYPPIYANDGSPIAQILFALKNEPLDLRILCAALRGVGAEAIQNWVKKEPTGAYARRVWFLYEKFIDELDLPDVQSGNYVDALDSKKHYTLTRGSNSKRQRVRDNLLGNSNLCPIVRRTPKLEAFAQMDLAGEARQITQSYDATVLARAINYLYTKETRSSFAIEGETPSSKREELFFQALREAGRFFPVEKSKLFQLQNRIVDPRYAEHDWRPIQNFVGQTTYSGEEVHFITAKPEDVESLMQGWLSMSQKLVEDHELDPVVAASISSFAFVFIHPFEDGNGRTHRFIIQAFLNARGYGPGGLILPVSAAILRKKVEYDRILESFSRPLMRYINWQFLEDTSIQVHNHTRDLYRFFDATMQTEFLYERLAEAVRTDLQQEAHFLELFDSALRAVRAVVDMPDRKAQSLALLCLNNGGKLAARKRNKYSEITEAELERIEIALKQLIEEKGSLPEGDR